MENVQENPIGRTFEVIPFNVFIYCTAKKEVGMPQIFEPIQGSLFAAYLAKWVMVSPRGFQYLPSNGTDWIRCNVGCACNPHRCG
jgi:hypothetical protein